MHTCPSCYVVIFKAKVAQLDSQYSEMAARLRQLAFDEFGCSEFVSLNEGDLEVALSYWPSLEHIQAWKKHSDHLIAQSMGQEKWYASYTVEIAQILRQYNK